MTYDTALNLVIVLAIPAVVLVTYRLFAMSRRNVNQNSSPFAYEIDPESGEIVFGDEKQGSVDTLSGQPVNREVVQDEPDVSMLDVLETEETQKRRLTDVHEAEGSREKTEA